MPSISKASADIPGQFTEAYGTQTSAAGADAWEDWDVSAIVGINEAVVFLVLSEIAAAGVTAGVRTNGSTSERLFSLAANEDLLLVALTDALGVLERRCNTAANRAGFRIVGWFT